MISTLMKISLTNLRRDRVALTMVFILPLIFFSIFAVIFGGIDLGEKETKIKVLTVDRDQTDVSRGFIQTLHKEKALDVTDSADETQARKAVHDGKFPVVVILQKGFSTAFGNFASDKESVELVYDAANPIAQNAVGGLLQATAFMFAPDILIEKGFSSMETLGAGLTPQQSQALHNLQPYLRGDKPWPGAKPGSNDTSQGTQGMLKIRTTDVRAGESAEPQHSMIAYYAAGIGVMFLLFSMSAGGGALLDETDSGTLERLLSTNASMTQILMAKWLYLSVLGVMQVSVMFLWGALAFHLDLFTPSHLSGFIAMAIPTAAAAAAFGLVLAGACKTRAQLGSISMIINLIMSALGGSMVPRFVMPKFMATTALFTFNGWALDGFLKVFWFGDPKATIPQTLTSLTPQLAMISALAVVFLITARKLAKRWEAI